MELNEFRSIVIWTSILDRHHTHTSIRDFTFRVIYTIWTLRRVTVTASAILTLQDNSE